MRVGLVLFVLGKVLTSSSATTAFVSAEDLRSVCYPLLVLLVVLLIAMGVFLVFFVIGKVLKSSSAITAFVRAIDSCGFLYAILFRVIVV